MSQMIDVLIVEDNSSLARVYEAYLDDSNYSTRLATTLAAAKQDIDLKAPDIVLLDIQLPDGSGMDILQELSVTDNDVQTIVMTSQGSSEMAVEAIRLGAFDFLTKPFDASRLLVTLDNATKHHHLNQQVATYSSLDRKNYCSFVGQSISMQAVYRIIDSVAASKATAFVLGESGTGKELVAEAIHQESDRASGPFHVLNCGAIPTELMESELFGHVKGAFSGATTDREGAASAADGGTLFLDEICEMDLDLQSKLLRFIQLGAVRPVGSDKTETVDVRFVCATNKDPLEEVRAGRFREDLYYRLHVIPIDLPPLRAREKDVLLITDHFLKRFAKSEGSGFKKLSSDAKKIFLKYPWPGNVRELENLLHRLIVLNDGAEITVDMLPAEMQQPGHSAVTGVSPASIEREMPSSEDNQYTAKPQTLGSIGEGTLNAPEISAGENISLGFPSSEVEIPSLALAEERFIQHVIKVCDGNVHRAAGFLQIAPSTIYRKMRSWENSPQKMCS